MSTLSRRESLPRGSLPRLRNLSNRVSHHALPRVSIMGALNTVQNVGVDRLSLVAPPLPRLVIVRCPVQAIVSYSRVLPTCSKHLLQF